MHASIHEQPCYLCRCRAGVLAAPSACLGCMCCKPWPLLRPWGSPPQPTAHKHVPHSPQPLLLLRLKQERWRLVQLKGGDKRNAIAREAVADILVRMNGGQGPPAEASYCTHACLCHACVSVCVRAMHHAVLSNPATSQCLDCLHRANKLPVPHPNLPPCVCALGRWRRARRAPRRPPCHACCTSCARSTAPWSLACSWP
jgi:hypothetical protein